MNLSSSARKQTTVGEIVNLMAVDASRLQQLPPVTTVIWVMPLLVLITIAMLWAQVGPSALTVLLVLAIVVPVNGIAIANMIRKLQVCQIQVTRV